RLAQLTAPRSGGSPTPGPAAASAGAGDDDGLRARYAAALQEAIRSKWIRPDNVQSGALCVLRIRQLPGGEVMEVSVGSPCVFDEQGQRSIEAAVRKAEPLPYAGFEKVFSRDLKVNFRAP
ncbi:MAG TPA: TonB C-terminal domain-containing protein, partial [Lysobacter sp.]|nr:TonB C-terminal domain-containing protein [Lysobacter sp.]